MNRGPAGASPGALASIWWVAVGVIASSGVASMLTIGLPLIALAVAMGVAGSMMPWTRNRSVSLVIAGVSFAPFLIAWLNRDGPGTICTSLSDGEVQCIDEWSPWPFLAVAFLLVFLGILAALLPSVTAPGAPPGVPPGAPPGAMPGGPPGAMPGTTSWAPPGVRPSPPPGPGSRSASSQP